MAKKNFGEITNPALQFMSTHAESSASSEPAAAGFNGLKRGRPASTEETKSKRVNLLMLPSVYADITKIATMKRTSVNELLHTLMQSCIEENTDLIEKYNQTFKE